MKNFLLGLAIGVPTGMLVADHRQAIADSFRNAFRKDLRGVSGTNGASVAAEVNQVADEAREGAGSSNESWMQAGRPKRAAR